MILVAAILLLLLGMERITARATGSWELAEFQLCVGLRSTM